MAVGGTSAYDGIGALPPLVQAAVDLARRLDFDHSCEPEQGRLLAVLARGWSGGRVGETGTGCGVGLAWMVESAEPTTSFVSVEIDQQRATEAARLFADQPNVTIVQGDYARLVQHGPFDLLVLDGGGKGKDPSDPPLDPTVGWLAPGGTIVLDDFTPGEAAHDPARSYWLNHPALAATELRLSPSLATIVGMRVP